MNGGWIGSGTAPAAATAQAAHLALVIGRRAIAMVVLALFAVLMPAVAWADSCTFEDFLERLGQRESGRLGTPGSWRYNIVNSYGFLGKYQFGEAALIDIGFYTRDGSDRNDFRGSWGARAREFGVNSKQDFLNNGAAQEAAIRAYMAKQWGYANSFNLTRFVGTTINGIPLTESGILMGMHLGGIDNMRKWLESGGRHRFADGYGTSLETYVRLGTGFETPYGGTGSCTGNTSPGGPGPGGGGDIWSGGPSGTPYRPPSLGGSGSGSAGAASALAACDPQVEATMMEAQAVALEQARDDIAKSVLEPAALKVISCLNDILNSGISIAWGFNPPNLANLFNELANRICQAMNKLFNEATEDLRAGFQHSSPFTKFDVRLRKGQGDLFKYNVRWNSPIDGQTSRVQDAFGANPTIDVDIQRRD